MFFKQIIEGFGQKCLDRRVFRSATEIVDLEGWTLRVEVRDSQPVHRYTTIPFKAFEVMPNTIVLVVTRQDRNSGNIPERRIYEVKRRHHKGYLLRSEGFSLRLYSPDGDLVDVAGNLDGKIGQDTPRWELPSGTDDMTTAFRGKGQPRGGGYGLRTRRYW